MSGHIRYTTQPRPCKKKKRRGGLVAMLVTPVHDTDKTYDLFATLPAKHSLIVAQRGLSTSFCLPAWRE